MLVDQANITLDLNGHVFNANGGLYPLSNNGSPAGFYLYVQDGTLNSAGGIGLSWQQRIEVTDGGVLNLQGPIVVGGGNNSSRSSVLVSGSGSQISATRLVMDGGWAGGVMIENNATFTTTGSSIIRNGQGNFGTPSPVRGHSNAEVIIGSGGTWNSYGEIALAPTSSGALYVDSGGLLDTVSIVLGDIDALFQINVPLLQGHWRCKLVILTIAMAL